MNFIKKQAAGFYLMLLALILGTAGIVFYVINCNTAYFSNLGISWGVVGCLVAGVVLEILFVAGQEKSPEMPVLDILPILAGVLLMAGFVFFVRLRVTALRLFYHLKEMRRLWRICPVRSSEWDVLWQQLS